MDRALCLYLLSNFATSNKKISMKTKMIVVVVLAAMCVLPLSAQVKVGVEGGMNLSHYLVSGSDRYKADTTTTIILVFILIFLFDVAKLERRYKHKALSI
jgi:hypothetical protein